jgi:curved DNA-binding protein CbpA
MERYYRILGISNNASKEEIKKAYHEKMKSFHPDKVHGTPLEDTATFFSTEINEAYNILISQFNENHRSSSHNEYIEDEIFVENIGLLKYTLSNDITVIINAIIKQTKNYFPDTIDEIPWALNSYLSENVKKSMNKHNMNFSMTIYMEGSIKKITLNKRTGNNWYIAAYEINTEHQEKKTPPRYNETYNNQYQTYAYKKKESNAKTGFFIGILNILHLIIIYMNKHNITLLEDERTIIIFAWAIITLVVAITGFFLSRKGYVEEQNNKGYGIAGMAFNGLVILPTLFFLLSAIFSSHNGKRK